MADIKQRISNIKAYFQEMQITQVDGTPIIYVIVKFPPKWVIDNDIEEKFGVTVGQQSDSEYYFCADIETGESAIFDAIEYNIARMKEALERASLLAAKVNELRTIFGDETISIESLRTLEFTYKGKKRIPKPSPKIEEEEKPQKAETENTENNEENTLENE